METPQKKREPATLPKRTAGSALIAIKNPITNGRDTAFSMLSSIQPLPPAGPEYHIDRKKTENLGRRGGLARARTRERETYVILLQGGQTTLIERASKGIKY